MATVKDLEAVFNAEPRLSPGAVRMVTRLLQDGGLLPKGRPGGWRKMPELTPQHCAIWLVGLAVTRRSGLRNVNEAVTRVNRFLELEQWMGGSPCFGDVLVQLIEIYISGGNLPGFTPDRFTFLNDDTLPRVEISSRENDGYQVLSFVELEETRKPAERYPQLGHTDFTDAFIIDARVLSRFREVFNRTTAPAEAEDPAA